MAGRPSAQPAWTAEDYAALGAFMQAFNQELLDSGELVETRGLSAPVHSRRVAVTTDVGRSLSRTRPPIRTGKGSRDLCVHIDDKAWTFRPAPANIIRARPRVTPTSIIARLPNEVCQRGGAERWSQHRFWHAHLPTSDDRFGEAGLGVVPANCSGRSAPLPAWRRRRFAASSSPCPAFPWAASTTAGSSARSPPSEPRRALVFSRAFRASSARRPACSDSERATWASWTAWATRRTSAKRSLQAVGVSLSRSAWAMRAATDLMVPRGT